MGKEKEEDGKVEIPIIDMQDFPPSQYSTLREACEEWGCFRLVNHKVSLTLMGEMKEVVRSLLDLPMEVKERNKDVIPGSGYMAPTPINPLYEALGIYDMGSSLAVDTFCSQLGASPHQREVMSLYAKAINELANVLANKMAESLGLIITGSSSIGSGRDLFKEWPSQFRINKYHFTPDTVGSSGVQIHTDSSFLTILQDDELVGGLEVFDNTSGTFVPVHPVPGALLVNLGDIATAWSNGRFCNVRHRVQCKEAGVRISIASFLLGPKEAAIECPQELVDSQHPRLYLPFTYEQFRGFRMCTKSHAGEALSLVRNPPICSS